MLELEQLQKEEMQKKLQDLEEMPLDATEAARNFKLTKKDQLKKSTTTNDFLVKL